MSAKDRWSLRNIYLYLVCLITLIMVIFATVGLVRNTVELIYPDPGYYEAGPIRVPEGEMTPELEEKQRQSSAEYQRKQSQRQAVLGLVGNIAMLAVAGPLYIYHWRRIERDIAEDAGRQTEVTTS